MSAPGPQKNRHPEIAGTAEFLPASAAVPAYRAGTRVAILGQHADDEETKARGGSAWPWTTRPSRSCSTRATCRPTGTTSSRTCRARPPPPLHPGTGQPLGPADLAPLFPMELIMQEVSPGAAHRDPRPGPRRLPALAAHAAVPRAPAGEGARYPRPHLLQVRGRQPGRQPQAEHRRRPGVLQQAGGHQAPDHRDRRRPVGQRARHRLRACSASSARSTWSRPPTSRSRTAAR